MTNEKIFHISFFISHLSSKPDPEALLLPTAVCRLPLPTAPADCPYLYGKLCSSQNASFQGAPFVNLETACEVHRNVN